MLLILIYDVLIKFWFNQSERSVLSAVNNIYFVCLGIAEYIEIMSEKFHLYTGIFRIHWFETEFFGADDFDFVVVFHRVFTVKKFFLESAAFLMSCNQFVFVLAKLSLNDFFYKIDGYIHIIADLFGADDRTLDWNRYLDFLPLLLHT